MSRDKSRETSPHINGAFWLCKRRDGKSPDIWQVATSKGRTVVYRSTRKRSDELDAAKAFLDAHVAEQKALGRQEASEALVAAILVTYWREKGRKAVNHDQTARSLRTFLGFLMQDQAAVTAVVTDLTPALFERFREWRMGPHEFELEWFGETYDYESEGVSGDTVQRNINDVRAAVHHAAANMRIPLAPRISDIDERYRSPLRERVLTMDEMTRIAWYASHHPELFRFVALQFATAVRPDVAKKFDPRSQWNGKDLIDLQPGAAPQTKKRNAVIPAIWPIRPVLRQWKREGASPVTSHKTAWRNMRRVLKLSDDVHAKTIRHTVATLLYSDESVPEREIVELLGHEGKLARTTRIYAKYDPTRLRNVARVLTTLWRDIKRQALAFDADHSLATVGQGRRYEVLPEPHKRGKFSRFNGGRGRD